MKSGYVGTHVIYGGDIGTHVIEEWYVGTHVIYGGDIGTTDGLRLRTEEAA